MSALHDSLKILGPVDWHDVPSDNLKPYLTNLFQAGELICNSVPASDGGVEFTEAQPTQSKPNSASSAKEIVASDVRPAQPSPDQVELQKSWGKPMKIAAKDNPLGISVYKMAGKDRNGAWFARRSVLEGISFTKFRKAMQREFPKSLAVQGGPGEGNVRGIGGDRRLEKKTVDSAGQIDVYQLSAQFPGPTTPREFIALVATSTEALTDKSAQNYKGDNRIPRHFMVVSKPCTHPDAPDRGGYVKGFYESVEMIREIPIHPATTNDNNNREKSKDNEDTKDEVSPEQELNPVEWIMITRSDPGGGIPRFMVERGTPSSICGDAVKFLDWACPQDEIPDPDADEEEQNAAAAQHANAAAPVDGASPAPPQHSTPSPADPANGGMLSNLTNALEAGIDAYAPTSVAAYTHNYLHGDSDSSDLSSDDSSFMSAVEGPAAVERQADGVAAASTDSFNKVSSRASTSSVRGFPEHDKEMSKLEEKRRETEVKLAKKKETEADKLAAAKLKDNSDIAKAQEKHDKEVRKIEEKRQKELAKIKQREEKERQKIEKKQQKNLDRDTLSRISRERDDFRSQVEALRRENALLLQQYADLQDDNANLMQKLNQSGGVSIVQPVKDAA